MKRSAVTERFRTFFMHESNPCDTRPCMPLLRVDLDKAWLARTMPGLASKAGDAQP